MTFQGYGLSNGFKLEGNYKDYSRTFVYVILIIYMMLLSITYNTFFIKNLLEYIIICITVFINCEYWLYLIIINL